MVSLFAEVILLNVTLPLFFELLHDTILLKRPVLLHAISQLINFSKVMISMIHINAIIVPILFGMLLIPFLNAHVEAVIFCSYFILLCMMLLCFIVKLFIYIPSKVNTVKILKAIGYQNKQIYSIQRLEIIGFLVFIVGLPMLLYSFILYRGYSIQLIAMSTAMLLAISYCVLYILISIFMIVTYNQAVKKGCNDDRNFN